MLERVIVDIDVFFGWQKYYYPPEIGGFRCKNPIWRNPAMDGVGACCSPAFLIKTFAYVRVRWMAAGSSLILIADINAKVAYWIPFAWMNVSSWRDSISMCLPSFFNSLYSSLFFIAGSALILTVLLWVTFFLFLSFPLFALKQKVEQRLQGWREAPPPSLANAQQPVITGFIPNCSHTILHVALHIWAF